MRAITGACALLAVTLLTGCTAMKESTPIRDEAVKKGLVIVRSLPKALPGKAAPVPDSQYVLVNVDSGVVQLIDMAMPIPFVTGFAADQINQHAASKYKAPYASVDPYAIAVERMEGSPLLSGRPDALHLFPFVYAVEGSDDMYRMTLVFRVESEGWLGRYMYHMPQILTAASLKNPSPEQLQQLSAELMTGATTLRQLMERDARGELKPTGTKVDIGSLYLVGSNIGGVVSAGLMHYPDTDLAEEGDDYVIVRSKGDMKANANAGGLVFGVHYFHKNQLHTFKKKETVQ